MPFTEALVPSGLVSWGYDPPVEVKGYATSWRTWVTNKLAAYLHASDAGSAEGRVEFALRRLTEDGVDTLAWRALPGL